MSSNVIALPAASVIVVRDHPFEILMLRRHAKSSFVPNAWVFPGGVTEPADREIAGGADEVAAMRVTGARETFEESGLWLGSGSTLTKPEEKRRLLLAGVVAFRELLREAPIDFTQLVPTSRWITPDGVPKRFDTWFFIARVSREVEATAEQSEAVDVTWVSPEEALARHAAGQMQMVFPTLRNLEAITGFATAEELIHSRAGAEIRPVQPVIVNGEIRLP